MKTFATLLVLLTAACGGGSDLTDDSPEMSPMMEVADVEAAASTFRKASAPTQIGTSEIEKKVIKSGRLTYRVDSNQEEYERISKLLEKYEAYILSENEYKGGDRVNFNLTVKVPPQHFDGLLAAVAEDRTLENRYINTSDVTERYYDLESRIGSKQELETRYLEILKEARTVSDLLEVERSLNQVRTEIESLQGQFKMLNHQIDYSNLDISFYELLPYQLENDQRPGFGKRLVNALSGGWGILLSVVVGVVQLWPFGLLAFLVIWIIKRVRQQKKDRA